MPGEQSGTSAGLVVGSSGPCGSPWGTTPPPTVTAPAASGHRAALTRADASRGPHTGSPAGQECTPATRVRGPAPQCQRQVLLQHGLGGDLGLRKECQYFKI